MAKPIETATLTWRKDLSDTLGFFRFELQGGVPDYLPGQFITLGGTRPADDGKPLWRAYSIASPPSEKRWLELYIRMPMAPVPGAFTSQLWELPVGGTLPHRGITGPFTIEEKRPDGSPDLRTLLCIAGGTGIAPFIAYALELRKRASPRRMIVVHGASHVHELGYDELLRSLEDETRGASESAFRLRYFPTISRPQDAHNAGWRGLCGRAESLVIPPEEGGRSRLESMLGEDITPDGWFCHACGYEGTVKAAQTVLEPRGFVSRRNRRPDGSFDLKVESYG